MTQNAFYFDQSRCTDCRTCSISCKDWKDSQPGNPKLLRRFTWETGTFPLVKTCTVYAPCYHCEEPACLEACPTGSIVKDPETGAVLVDADTCAGCESCWKACPYGAPQFAERDGKKTMAKCDMCIVRLRAGDKPACVNSCSMRALDFGPIDEIKAKYGECAQLEGMPEPTTAPAVVFTQAPEKKNLVPYDAERAAVLFGQRPEKLGNLYDDPSVLVPAEGVVVKNRLVMKGAFPGDGDELGRSEEW